MPILLKWVWKIYRELLHKVENGSHFYFYTKIRYETCGWTFGLEMFDLLTKFNIWDVEFMLLCARHDYLVWICKWVFCLTFSAISKAKKKSLIGSCENVLNSCCLMSGKNASFVTSKWNLFWRCQQFTTRKWSFYFFSDKIYLSYSVFQT